MLRYSVERNNEQRNNEITNKGFTYIELLITLGIIAVLFVPVMQLFSQSLYSTSVSQDLITATNLAKWEMERIKNLSVTKDQLRAMGYKIHPPLEEEPIEMNKVKWRIERYIVEDSDPLEVHVSVYRDSELNESIITLVTLVDDMIWEEQTVL